MAGTCLTRGRRVTAFIALFTGIIAWCDPALAQSTGAARAAPKAQPIAAPKAQPAAPAAPANLPQDPNQYPGKSARLITLPKQDNRALRALIANLATKYELENGYASGGDSLAKRLPPLPEKVIAIGAPLSRVDGRTVHVLRFGLLRQSGQLPQLWLWGAVVGPEGIVPNPDTENVEDALAGIVESRKQNEATIAVAELETRILRLSYIDADSAMAMLKSMGFSTFLGKETAAPAEAPPPSADGKEPPKSEPDMSSEPVRLPTEIGNDQLPVILKVPGPKASQAGLVGGGEAMARDQLGLTVVLGATSRLAPETVASPSAQLMVMFNPERPEQFVRVRKVLSDLIDRAARQILVEGMVLEISRDGLDELGVQWNDQEGSRSLLLGSVKPNAGANTLDFLRDPSRNLVRQLMVRIQALVRAGKAEVLARPSVLTLDNRQATIRVGTDIPIATSKDASSAAESRVSFSFQYLPTGIQLNVRPRIDDAGNEVSMLIDATVSSTVPGRDLELRSPTGALLASAPTIATRRVQTYARIPDNTPLIIGGLISRDEQQSQDKVPLLGDLPFFGPLFRSTQLRSSKREVIIVLTPYILPEGRANFGRALPKDDDAFDSLDNQLFRDSYRLRAGDVFDTGYIRNNRRLLAYRNIVARIAREQPELVERAPFTSVADGRIPGEQILMNGMVYETLRRNRLGGEITPNRMLKFDDASGPDFRAQRLDSLMASYGDGANWQSFFTAHPDQALAIIFEFQRASGKPGTVLEEPKAKVALVPCCKDRTEWKKTLWELNRPSPSGLPQYTILIKEEADVAKLSRAITVKRVMVVNGGEGSATIANFLQGRQLAIPAIQASQSHLIEAEVARYFLHTELYYLAFEEEFEATLRAIDTELRRPEFSEFFRADELPAAMRLERLGAAN